MRLLKIRLTGRGGCLIMLTALASLPAAAHRDISPFLMGTKIIVGTLDAETGEFELHGPSRPTYLGVAVPEDADLRLAWTINPGLSGASADLLPPSANTLANRTISLQTTLLPGHLTTFAYWSGHGVPSFTAIPHGEVLSIITGSSTMRLDFSTPAGELLPIFTVPAGGEFHTHPTYLLAGNASATPDPISPGFYFTALQVAATGGVQSSDPFVVITAVGFDELAPQSRAALQLAASAVVPEPAAPLAVLLGLLVLHLRRRA